MRVPAKVDYAIQAAAELATAGPGRLKSGQIAKAQQLPPKFPENIRSELKHAGIVESHRGAEGGYQLGRPADQITLADIIRAVDGPLAKVRQTRPQSLPYPDPASRLLDVWIAARVSLRSVLEHVTLADLVAGTLPSSVRDLTKDPTPGSPTSRKAAQPRHRSQPGPALRRREARREGGGADPCRSAESDSRAAQSPQRRGGRTRPTAQETMPVEKRLIKPSSDCSSRHACSSASPPSGTRTCQKSNSSSVRRCTTGTPTRTRLPASPPPRRT